MQVFSVDAVGYKSIAFVLAVAVFPAFIVFIASWATQGRGNFFAWFALGVVTLAALGLLAQLFAARATIDGSRITVGGGLYSVSVHRDVIQKDEVRVLSPTQGSYGLGYRTNGVGMPGLSLGWFQPIKGKKVFALVTQGTPILVPTTLDYDLVISPVDSEQFLSAIRGM